MDQELQIINGQFYTKPEDPQVISRGTVESWLADAQASKDEAAQAHQNAIDSKTTTAAQIDATISTWADAMAHADERIVSIQGWLDDVPE